MSSRSARSIQQNAVLNLKVQKAKQSRTKKKHIKVEKRNTGLFLTVNNNMGTVSIL